MKGWEKASLIIVLVAMVSNIAFQAIYGFTAQKMIILLLLGLYSLLVVVRARKKTEK